MQLTIPQLIRRWQVCNSDPITYGVYSMTDLVADIKKSVAEDA